MKLLKKLLSPFLIFFLLIQCYLNIPSTYLEAKRSRVLELEANYNDSIGKYLHDDAKVKHYQQLFDEQEIQWTVIHRRIGEFYPWRK